MTLFARRLFFVLCGCALFALSAALAFTIIKIPLHLTKSSPAIWVVAGFAVGILFFGSMYKFLTIYVFGHELTHWLTAKFFLRRTGKLTVSASGGSVAVENPNIWIMLAPYFVPIYTVIWIGVYGLYQFFMRTPHEIISTIFNLGIGVTYSFHVILTIYALLREQDDLKEYGYFLSMNMILFMNIFLLFMATLITSQQWGRGFNLLFQNLQAEFHFAINVVTMCYEQLSLWFNHQSPSQMP